MFKKLMLAAAVSFAVSSGAGAATQGTLGATSTGSYNINATIPPLVRISGLKDQTVTFTAADISAAVACGHCQVTTIEQKFCVYSNQNAAGGYGVTVTGYKPPAGGPQNAGNETFGLQGNGTFITMRVNYSDNPSNDYSHPFVTNNVELTGLTATAGGNARPNTLDCSDIAGGVDASIIVGFPVDAILAAVQGTYTGTLTLTVSPT